MPCEKSLSLIHVQNKIAEIQNSTLKCKGNLIHVYASRTK